MIEDVRISKSQQQYPRRQFLKKLTSLGALSMLAGKFIPRLTSASTAYPPRVPMANPYIADDGRPLLVAVNGTDFEKMLDCGLEAIGGLTRLINNNQSVLIKPNLNAVDVYPAISSAASIAVLAKKVAQATTNIVYVGDEGFHVTADVYRHANLQAALADTGAFLIDFSSCYRVRRATWDAAKPDYLVYADPYDSQIIINFACIKRHFLAMYTGALKNNVGAVSGSGASDSRGYFHRLSDQAFLAEVAEIAGLINPELTIIDARSMLIKNGPFTSSVGAQILNDVNYLVISGDMIAVDLYCSMLLQADDSTFTVSRITSTLDRAHALGLGVRTLDQVKVVEISTSGVEAHVASVPGKFCLFQNYPNPFNATTKIKFILQENYLVNLTIYDAIGRAVTTILNKEMYPGEYTVAFDANGLASGTYFSQLKVGRQVLLKSMTMIK